MIPHSDWEWFGSPGHFICAFDCRFHLCTRIGDFLVSTVGEYFPDAPLREILASSRGVTLEGKGDARKHDYMKKIGFEEIGFNRTYETFVFVAGKPCNFETCRCGQPSIASQELAAESANERGEATRNHYAMCVRVACGEVALPAPEEAP